MQRQVFYSFHYENDVWRASQVRNIGVVEGNKPEGNKPVADNDWEKITKGGDSEIKRWINEQMKDRSCTVVLVGSETADRKWINYEIKESWEKGMGVVGIYIHGLLDSSRSTSHKGKNPFDDKRPFTNIIPRCHEPIGSGNEEKYKWISEHLSDIVEKAIIQRQS